MKRDTAQQNRLPSGAVEGRPAQDHPRVDASQEPSNALRSNQSHGGTVMRLTRRGVIESVAGAVGGLVLGGVGHIRSAMGQSPSHPVPEDPTKLPGRPASPYGFRSQFDTAARWPAPYATTVTVSMTPLHEARGIITPSSLHHEVHHGGVPTIDPAKHTLLIHGLVQRPLQLTVDDVMRFPSVT